MRKLLLATAAVAALVAGPTAPALTQTGVAQLAPMETTHLRNIKQLTFGGENAEAYFSHDGKQISFQSTRAPYKCDQQFTMNADGSNVKLISTGKGRTTCGYFTPDGTRMIYASTHLDSPDCPMPPNMAEGYVWAIYPSFDIFSVKTDGTDIKRLTNTPGYDGGAWHSQDGQYIVWRANRPKTPEEIARYKDLLSRNLVMPSRMELMIMRADGTEKKQLTFNGAANFAPYFHPNGRQIIFASNMKDPRGGNFDLYLINRDGTGLQQVTFDQNFDGFAMFSPDGKKLVWESNRNEKVKGETNVFIADWVE